MTRHIYSIGQQVSFDGRVRTYLKPAGVFTVTKLLPPLGVELQYRIKSQREAHERVAVEHELQVAELAMSSVAADSRLSSVNVNVARVFAGLSNNNRDHLCDQLGTSGQWLNALPDDTEDNAAALELSQQPSQEHNSAREASARAWRFTGQCAAAATT
jgi:hypothetical protein